MKRKEIINDHIDSAKLFDLVHAVEDRHHRSVIPASDEEMEPIWKLTKPPKFSNRPKITVTQEQYWLIESYSRVGVHTAEQKAETLRQLGENYGWLNRRIHEYRMKSLEVKE